jgi:hypothetical protein
MRRDQLDVIDCGLFIERITVAGTISDRPLREQNHQDSLS